MLLEIKAFPLKLQIHRGGSLLIWSLCKIQIYISTYYVYVYLWMFPHLTNTYGIPNMRYSSHQWHGDEQKIKIPIVTEITI